MTLEPLPTSIVAAARSWIGTPYHHQASVKGVGCDCLGLLRGIWRDVIGPEPAPLPPYRPDWAEAGGAETLLDAAMRHLRPLPADKAQAGDVLLFRWRAHLPAKHSAILTGDRTMIHAHDGAAVAEVALTPWWSRHRAGAFRFPDIAASARSFFRRPTRSSAASSARPCLPWAVPCPASSAPRPVATACASAKVRASPRCRA